MPKKRQIPKFFFQGKVLKSENKTCKNGTREKTEFTVLDTDRNKEVNCVCWSRYLLNEGEHIILKGFFLKPCSRHSDTSTRHSERSEESNPLFIADYINKTYGHIQDFYSNFGAV